MLLSSAVQKRLIIAPQTTFNVVPNSSGVWTTTGAKILPYSKADIQRIIGAIDNDSKTGTATAQPDITGRVRATGAFTLEMALSGTAGTASNLGLLLKNMMGIETLNAGTSAVYTLADGAVAAIIMALFNEVDAASTVQFAYGGIVTDATINLGGDGYLAITPNMQFVYSLESDNWANEDTAGKAGLTTTPAEPGSLSLIGGIVAPYLSSLISIGGNTPVEFVSGQLSIMTGRNHRYDGGKYSTGIVQGKKRDISVKSLKMADSNGAALAANKNAAASRAAQDITIIQGGTAGYTATHALKGCQLGNYQFSDSDTGVDITFDAAKARGSAILAKDEYTITLT